MHTRLKGNYSPRERFEALVVRTPDTCWAWRGGLNGNGYACLRVNGKTTPAHRYAYETLVGPIADGCEIDHLCRNRWCTNPSHLEVVTPRENWRRGTSPSARNLLKTHCKYGHELSGENLVTRTDNAPVGRVYRACRKCRAAQAKAWRDRQIAAGAPRDQRGRVRASAIGRDS